MFPAHSKAHRYLRLTRRIRYRTLDALIGEAVTIRSEPTVIDDVVRDLGARLPKSVSSVRDIARGLPTVAKYGLLDLVFSLHESETALQRLSVAQLRELGLLSGGTTTKAELSSNDDEDGCVEQLLKEAEIEPPVLKLILDAADDQRSATQRMKDALRRTPSGYFPALFRVRDCCITNAPSIWLGKHFYL